MKPIFAIALIAIILGLILGRAFKKSVIRDIKKHFTNEDPS